MKTFILIIGLMLLHLLAFAQTEKEIIIIGYVLNIENLQPIQLANISITPSNKKFISNRKGIFKIQVQKDDSVAITAIGFSSLHLHLKDLIKDNDTIIILLKPLSYELKGVTIVGSNPKRDSIARIAAQILAHDTLLNNYDRIYNRPRGTVYLGAGIIYEGMIQDLYNKFSKEGKDNIRFEEFVQYALKQKQIDERYNKKVIKQLTSIDENNMDDFILFCKLDRTFILTAPEYDLFLAIRKCADEFNGKKMKERTRLR